MSLRSWGRYPKVASQVHTFDQPQNLKHIIDTHHDLIPWGNGRSYGDSALSSNIISVKNKDLFLAFEPSTGLLTVEAGVLLGEIIETYVPKGWFLQVTPGTKFVTVGGAIASDVHGKNHHLAGCFSESIKQFSIMLADGEIVSCSKTQMPKLFKATCGGMGLTGVILSAQIYLKKINSSTIEQTTIKTSNLQQTFDAFEDNKSAPYSVAWIDCLAKGDKLGKGMVMTGNFADDGKLDYQPQKRFDIRIKVPGFLLNRLTVGAFNWLYYKKAQKGVSQQKVDIDSFFYPLDCIDHWNRIYGKYGFTQYQFILPKQQSYQGLEEILTAISASGKGSFLAVLKLYGPANDNYLSFPLEGYSLALDFKMYKGLFALLERLDQIVLKYHGRIYLSKDVRVSETVFEQGYPHIDTFRQFRKSHHMDSKFQSLQSARINL
ncbi:MAG: decaprenylphospho-beta-D-ribofuranose 2-oxidase [Phenylobacterium sp.]|jgi:decaprenylphospho-beta-D-ribofuranose 2-oxidase